MHLSPDALLRIQIAALFVSDTQGRLRFIREPGYQEAELDPAPRFFLGRTLHSNVWCFRDDLPDAVIQAVDQVCQNEPIAENLFDPPQHAAEIRALLHKHAPITHDERGPAYWMPDDIDPPAQAVCISAANAHLLTAHFPWSMTARSNLETRPLVATVVQDAAVSICFCARITDVAAEAGVETAAALRGYGYASTAVAGWAQVMRQRGRIPLYSTSWQNRASQRVAGKLGMRHYADDWSIT